MPRAGGAFGRLPHPMARPLPENLAAMGCEVLGSLEEPDENDSRDKAPHMGPEGDTP